MQEILIGTGNRGKFLDISDALSTLPIVLKQPFDLGITEIPPEEGATFLDNAREKARFYHARSSLPTLADDSGITVEAIAGELGIHTRRWGAGPDATDEEWVAFFLQRMRSEVNKRAIFTCVLCYIDTEGNEHVFEGSCTGTITETIEAPYARGVPIAGCFKPEGADRVYSAMSIHEKNRHSHRGRAVSLFREHLISVQP